MRSTPKVWNHLARRPGVAVLLALLISAEVGFADRFPPDPVEEVRQVLKSGQGRDLTARVQSLRTLADVRRALALQEWRPDTGGLDDTGGAERLKSFQLLVQRFKKDAGQILRQGTTDGRLGVLAMLAEMGPNLRGPAADDQKGIARTFAPEMAELIKKGDMPRVREATARSLGQIFPDPDVAAPALRALLGSRNVEERRAAASGMAALLRTAGQLASKAGTATGPQASVEDIAQAVRDIVPLAGRGLGDADREVRRSSAEAMIQAAAAVNNQAPQSRTTEEGAETRGDREIIERIRAPLLAALDAFKEQITTLGTALDDQDLEVRLSTQKALEELGSARLRLLRSAEPSPAPAGTSEPRSPRGAALDQGLPTPVALKLQAAAPDPLLRKLRDLLPVLQAQLRDPNVQIRLGAVDVLETLGGASTPLVPALNQATYDPNRFVRWAAARTLGKLGPLDPATTVPALAHLLRDDDLDVRLSASTAMDRFGPDAEAAVPELIVAVQSSDADVREAAIRTLGGIGTGAQAAVPALAAALTDAESGIRPYVAAPRVRQAAAEVLGRFGALAANAVPALRKTLDDPDPDVRRAASDALLSILQAEK